MSGLFESLSSAAAALTAQRMGLDVVGQNLANINTPGYTRRTLVLGEVPPSDPFSAGRGVTVVELRAMRDALIEGRLRREQGATAFDSALAGLAGGVEAAVGLPGQSLDSDLATFFNAFAALADRSTSAPARDVVVRAGASLAAAFAGLSGQLGTIQRDADAQIRSGIDEVNQLISELAGLNVDIAASSYDVASIRDRQGVVLARLAALADVSVLPREDGGVDVTLSSGQALLIGDNAYPLATSPNGLAAVSLEGADVTATLTGGRLGGLLHVRDSLVPGYLAQLDALAFDLAASVNAVHAAGYDATGAAAGNFFAAPAGVAGAAASLEVDAALLADSARVAASGTGAVGDNAIARQLAGLRDAAVASGGTRSVFDEWGRYVYEVASDAADARAAADSHEQIVGQITALQAQASGVSYDEEAAHMMRYQRAYEASARYFQAILNTLDTLMEMVR